MNRGSIQKDILSKTSKVHRKRLIILSRKKILHPINNSANKSVFGLHQKLSGIKDKDEIHVVSFAFEFQKFNNKIIHQCDFAKTI